MDIKKGQATHITSLRPDYRCCIPALTEFKGS